MRRRASGGARVGNQTATGSSGRLGHAWEIADCATRGPRGRPAGTKERIYIHYYACFDAALASFMASLGFSLAHDTAASEACCWTCCCDGMR